MAITSSRPSSWVSPWLLTTPDIRRFPPLDGDTRADIVVIGGGIVGALTAWECAQRGAKVILVERHHVGSGDTGFSTAFLLHVPDARFDVIRQQLGDHAFASLLTSARAAQNELNALVATHRIQCGWAELPALFGSYDSGNADLRAQWKAIDGFDPSAEWVSGPAAKPFTEAIRFDHQACWDPRAFVVALLSIPNPQLRVVEETEATRLTPDQPTIITTPHGTITADRVIVATGSLDALLPDLNPLLTPTISYALTARYPSGVPLADNLFWDTDSPYQYYRRLDERTMMLGGADRSFADHQRGVEDPHAKLREFLDRRFPGYSAIDRRWSGTLFETADGLPLVGQHPSHPSIFVASGFSGNGMVMGALASRWLAAAVNDRPDPLSAICSLSRKSLKKAAAVAAAPKHESRSPRRPFWLSPLLVLAAATTVAIPTVVFFVGHHGRGLWQSPTLVDFAQRSFPVFGLYAFTLVWAQIMLGSFTPFWRKFFPRVTTLHRRLGVFALVFALLHPTLLLIGVGPAVYLARTYVAPNLIPFIWLAYVQLFLLVTTASTALLMKLPWLRRRWRIIHLLNYTVFFSVLIHSWALGHDLQTSAVLRGLWVVYGLTVIIALVARILRSQQQTKKVRADSGATIDLGPLEHFPNHQAVPVWVGSTKVAIFRNDEKIWAIANTCSHAGGPLCEGAFDGKTVVCPWHGSRFDLQTGAVLRGPATEPQVVWKVFIVENRVILTK